MEFDYDGANEITIQDIEDFLNSDGAISPVEEEEEESQDQSPEEVVNDKPAVTETQAFARRLKEETNKIRLAEREGMARELGYESYEDFKQSREKDILLEKGLDPEAVSSVVEELVKKRLEENPLLKELDSYRRQQMEKWAQGELKELTTLTGGKITKLEEVPEDVIELWKTKGSLKGAYLELHAETLIKDLQAKSSKTSTSHLANPIGSPSNVSSDKRLLTEKERQLYKLFNPEVTDEELSKKYKNI